MSASKLWSQEGPAASALILSESRDQRAVTKLGSVPLRDAVQMPGSMVIYSSKKTTSESMIITESPLDYVCNYPWPFGKARPVLNWPHWPGKWECKRNHYLCIFQIFKGDTKFL